MTNIRMVAIVALMLATLACGDDSRGPVTPGTPAPSPTRVSGSVYDTAFRPLGGVRIEAVDGASAGVSTISASTGSFALVGAFEESTTFRASKEGYVTASAVKKRSPPSHYLLFELDVPHAAVVIAGEYTLTLTADPSCPDLPDAVRQRSYPVTVAPTTQIAGHGLHAFSINLTDPPFLPDYSRIYIGISGNYVGLYFAGDYSSLAERLAPNTYAHFEAYASATVEGPVLNTINTPFDGVVEQCELKSSASFSYRCPTGGDAVSRVSCRSQNHTLTLTRR